jgi:hypothetical protein
MRRPMPVIVEGGFIALIVFAGSLLLFNWPLVSVADGGPGILIYLFFLWATAIAGLRYNCRRQKRMLENGNEGDGQ